jgi:hypothetical protein
MTTVGLIVFWPSLFLIDGDNTNTQELARLKGEMDAIESAPIRSQCGIVFQKPSPPPPASSAPKQKSNFNQ